jgi:hypothetical protein
MSSKSDAQKDLERLCIAINNDDDPAYSGADKGVTNDDYRPLLPRQR